MGPLSTWKEATRIYSTWRSAASAGYWDFNLLDCGALPARRERGLIDGVDEGVRELLIDGWRIE